MILKNYPYNGQADYWWLRSPYLKFDDRDDLAWVVTPSGVVDDNHGVWDSYGRQLYTKRNINFALRVLIATLLCILCIQTVTLVTATTIGWLILTELSGPH